ADQRIREAIDLVGLTGFERAYPRELSGGMRQRVGLARALAVDAGVLLLDEPFSAVDEQNRRKFQEDLLRLLAHEKKTVIFVTHSIEEAVYISDQVAVLTRNPGRLSRIVRPEIDRSGDFDDLRRTPAYLDSVDEIWNELKGYLEDEEPAP
ncbi:MAG TPA: ATP-binding cassette domain-containing protein, partial [Geminicoccaceae bacterium]|nr:ATP-binding cassette domain-containing protein [Geminicoccaceae bacterium]